MSFNRENVIWQSQNGTWSIGFFTVDWVDYDGDPEWDVEYDFSSFEWVSTGHRSWQQARQAWHGANPGGSSIEHYSPQGQSDHYDEMAREFRKRGR